MPDNSAQASWIEYGRDGCALRNIPFDNMYYKQIQVESGWRHYASNGSVLSSPTGSMGLGQLNSRFYPQSTWEDPLTNLAKSMDLMAGYKAQFGTWRKALAAYNWGPANTSGYTKDGRTHPAWDGTRSWRCPHEGSVGSCYVGQMHHYLDLILGEGWPEPQAETEPIRPAPNRPQFQLGFKTLVDQLGQSVVGLPTTGEKPLVGTVQFTSKGMMLYDAESNNAYFFRSVNEHDIRIPDPSPVDQLVDMRGKLPVRAGYDQRNPYPQRDLSRVDSIDFHYTAGSPSSTVLAIAQYQTGSGSHEAFPAIAYHIVVDGSGTPHLCHDLDRRVWHNGGSGRNERAIGICYTGNIQPSSVQLKGLKEARLWCEEQISRKLTLQGHKDTYATACPGPAWPNWKSSV